MAIQNRLRELQVANRNLLPRIQENTWATVDYNQFSGIIILLLLFFALVHAVYCTFGVEPKKKTESVGSILRAIVSR